MATTQQKQASSQLVTPEFVRPYFEGKKKGRNYNKALDQFYHTSFHFDGYFIPPIGAADMLGQGVVDPQEPRVENPYFLRLIDMRRPSESDAIKLYRRNIYLPLTQSPCFKVYNSLRKIVKSQDWKIDYSKSKKPSNVADGEQLEDYCEKKYPFFGSIENWIYNYGLRHMLVDANAVCYVLPLPKEDPNNKAEYFRPFSFVVPSKRVYDFKENEYVVFLSDKKVTYQVDAGNNGLYYKEGRVLCIITKEGYWEAKQKDDTGQDFVLEKVMDFNLKKLPAWKLGGIDKEFSTDGRLYQSFIAPIIPRLDAAAREISDSDAEVVQHVYSTMWYFTQQNCTHCNGTGRMLIKGKQDVCAKCEGAGVQGKSPYKDMVLKSGSFDTDKMPTPPAGYIEKNTDMVKLQADRIYDHIYWALSSINMEWLTNTPMNTSGKAKEVDRDELNNFVYGVAYHLVENFVKPVYYFVNEFRYSLLVTNEETRLEMLPRIAVPEKFDLLTENIIEDQLAKAKDSEVDPEIINELEIEYINKKFSSEPEVRDRLKLKKTLDPFPQLDPAQKQELSLSRIADPIDITISIYIHPFLERAMHEHEDFMEWEYVEQIELMEEYAQEKMDKMNAANKAKMQALGMGQAEDPQNKGFDMEGNPMPKPGDPEGGKGNPVPKQKISERKKAEKAKPKK